MGRHLRICLLFAVTLLLTAALTACFEPASPAEPAQTGTTATTTPTVTTTTPPPEPPPVDPGYDGDGFENRPEDDETKRY